MVDPKAVRQRSIELEKATRARHKEIDKSPPKCAWCGGVIPAPRRYHASVKYCSAEHRQKKNNEGKNSPEHQAAIRSHADPRIKTDIPETFPDDQTRHGPVLERIRATLNANDFKRWTNSEIPNREVAAMPGVKASNHAVGMARKAAWNDDYQDSQRAKFKPKLSHVALLGPSDKEMADLLVDDPKAFNDRLDTLTDAFVDWRTEFFSVGFERAYITKDVHKRWIRATLKTIYTGGRLLVLSPPRHGKTDLLIHFSVWLICRNPDIRILWVGPNGDIAENCLGQVRDLLETHTMLQAAYLAPGENWAPSTRNSGLWQRAKFTVGNRNLTLKQPTMWCTGVGGKLLSIDADFIVVDDPADPDASYTAGGRDKIENWFKVKLITRKMFHTGIAMISSRVHPDDLYSLFVESENWEVVVDRAHDQSVCGRDLWEAHPDTEKCVLFPEVNPLEYLREQAEVVGQALFEMMYLNQPRPDGTLIFDPDIIRVECLDHSRGLGTDEIAGAYRLVAGLDPAARGVQAAFLWAVKLPRMSDAGSSAVESYYMVDLETQRAGGIEGALAVMRDWKEKYDNHLWVVEDNAYQSVFLTDPRLRALSTELGLEVRPTTTGKNKHDPDFGVAGMAPLFHEGKVSLPYAGPETSRKTEQYIKQLVNFTGETGRSGRKHLSDILMASWFPFATVIKKWRREERHAQVRVTQEASFVGYNEPGSNDLPWGGTDYPLSG